MTTPHDDKARELWQRALDEKIRAMTPEQRRALIERATDAPFQPVTDPNDPAIRQRQILQSIADKQAKAPAVDAQGKPIPGKLRWG